MLEQSGYRSAYPVILDEALGSPETVILRFEGGFQKNAGSPALPGCALMDSFRKGYRSQLINLPQTENTRELSVESSATYASPTFASQSYNSTPTTSTFDDVSRMPQVSFSQPQRSAMATTPQILSYQPQSGIPGTQILVHIILPSELYASSQSNFFFEFGATKVPASATLIEGRHTELLLAAKAPLVSLTEWQASQAPLTLILEDDSRRVVSRADVGIFEFIEGQSSSTNEFAELNNHSSCSGSESEQNTMSTHTIDGVKSEGGLSYNFSSSNVSQFYLSLNQDTSYLNPSAYSSPDTSHQQSTRSSRPIYQYSPSTTVYSQQNQSAAIPWSPYSHHRSAVAMGPGYTSRALRNALPPPMSTNPALVRTTALSQHVSSGPSISVGYGYKYPFSSLTDSCRAQLHLNGNLEAMANICDWAPEELECKRRIVMFKRSQHGSKITATFQPVMGEKPPQNSVCISCIFWKEKKDCFITSVDTIYLLESLAGSKFPTDEKNRIRRNMEGYHPLTVSKGKADSEEFFKTIMGFPNPKPRNIEKDIKVFSWKILSGGLKKIIGKYSAAPSFSVSRPPMLTPVSSYDTESSSGSMDHSSVLSHASHHAYQHEPSYSSHLSKRSPSGQSLSQYSSMSRPVSPQNLKSTYTLNTDLRISADPYYHQQQDQYSQPQSNTSTYLNSISTPPIRDTAWALGMTGNTYSDGYTGSINNQDMGVPDYGGNSTPVGVSIPKLLDMND